MMFRTNDAIAILVLATGVVAAASSSSTSPESLRSDGRELILQNIGIDFDDVDDFGWPSFDWEKLDLSNVDGWSDIFGFESDVAEICPALQLLSGIGEAFGIAGGCDCYGSIAEGLKIDCNFEDPCSSLSATCGSSVDFNLTLGESPGTYSADVCVEMYWGLIPDICYSYALNVLDSGFKHSCEASFGEKSCTCSIDENFCISLDCESSLPRVGKTNSCQLVGDLVSDDAESLIPDFQVFHDWGDVDFDDLSDVCPILEQFAGLGDEFEIAGRCGCSGSVEGGVSIGCSFDEVCIDDDAICGSASLSFDFDDDFGSVLGEACVDYAGDSHPTTCFSYVIPLTESAGALECGATYGGSPCGCTIDESYCVSIDCSAHNSTAVTDTCQILSWETADDAATFLPMFFDEAVTNSGKEGDATESWSAESNGASVPRSLLVAALGVGSIAFLL